MRLWLFDDPWWRVFLGERIRKSAFSFIKENPRAMHRKLWCSVRLKTHGSTSTRSWRPCRIKRDDLYADDHGSLDGLGRSGGTGSKFILIPFVEIFKVENMTQLIWPSLYEPNLQFAIDECRIVAREIYGDDMEHDFDMMICKNTNVPTPWHQVNLNEDRL